MKDDRVYLQHIRDALQDIAAYCGSDHGAFLDDRMRQDATLRKLEVIGQAVKNLSEDTKGLGFSVNFWTTEDIDATANRIKASGGRLDSEPVDAPWGARYFRLTDPDGFKLAVLSRWRHRGAAGLCKEGDGR